MSRLSRFISHGSTYANVVATLALFIALGGASYASVVLSAGSVGRAQLKAGSVTPRALGFPLGGQALNDTSPIVLSRNECNGGEPVPFGQPPPQCPVSRLEGPTVGHVTLEKSGELLVSGVVDVRNDAAPGMSASVRLGISIEPESGPERNLYPSSVALDGGQEEQVPVQGLVTLSSGHYAVRLGTDVKYGGGSAGSGEVILPETSIIATELPAAPR